MEGIKSTTLLNTKYLFVWNSLKKILLEKSHSQKTGKEYQILNTLLI